MYIHRDIQKQVSVKIIIGKNIARKLKEKHNVAETEVAQCFWNNAGKYLQDNREEHKTSPPTLWFIAQTDAGRVLKVVFLRYSPSEYVIKTSYAPNVNEIRIYSIYGRRKKKK